MCRPQECRRGQKEGKKYTQSRRDCMLNFPLTLSPLEGFLGLDVSSEWWGRGCVRGCPWGHHTVVCLVSGVVWLFNDGNGL